MTRANDTPDQAPRSPRPNQPEMQATMANTVGPHSLVVNEAEPQSSRPKEPGMQTNMLESHSHAPQNSKKSKDEPASPDMLAFYPPVWKNFLEDAKRECRISHTLLKNPFPSKTCDLKTSILESLTTSLVEWSKRGIKFKPSK
jgi:hypothetical protein